MKNKIVWSAVSFFLFSLFATAVFALDFDEAYMVSGPGNQTEKTTPYILDQEEPWFYFRFSNGVNPDALIGDSQTTAKWKWINPDGYDPTETSVSAAMTNAVWGNLENWGEVAKPGDWSLRLVTPLDPEIEVPVVAGTYTKNLAFKVSVIPEPASTALFILGAAAFGMGIVRKRNA